MQLPDGRVLKIGRERFEAAEALFNPSLLDCEDKGLADMLFETIQRADIDMRKQLFKHIVLSGGTTMFPGLPSRLEHDLRSRFLRDVLKGDASRAKKYEIRVEDPPRRKHMVFHGASLLGDIMRDREDFWMFKREWEEEGPRILRKCAAV